MVGGSGLPFPLPIVLEIVILLVLVFGWSADGQELELEHEHGGDRRDGAGCYSGSQTGANLERPSPWRVTGPEARTR